MSKNIVIQEGGIGKQLTVDKLRTNLAAGSACLWVPEDEIHLGTKIISENGTFSARDDGLYGYSEVTVSGIGSVTGYDPDTGEEVEVHRDPTTGEIVETVIPTEIRIVTPPTKTSYTHGETIDYSGIVVHKYSAKGTDLGVVPFNQLIFPESTADIQKASGMTDGQGLNAMMLYFTPHTLYTLNNKGEIVHEETVYVHGNALGTYRGAEATYGSSPGTYLATRYNDANYMCCIAGNRKADLYALRPYPGKENYRGWGLSVGSSSSAPTDRFGRIAFGEYLTNLPISTVYPPNVDIATLHTIQSIPVQWPRPDDGAILETSFNIQVNSAS